MMELKTFFVKLLIKSQWLEIFCGSFFFFFNLINYFNWRIVTSNIVVAFAICRHESAMGEHVSSYPEPPSHLLWSF